MSKENPNLDIPIEGEISKVTDVKSKLSLEEIEAEVSRRNKAKKFENKPVKKPNIVDPLEIDPNDKPPVKEIEEVQSDPRLKDKTAEELQDMYLNLEKLQKSQTDELGTLRKENKDFKEQEDKDKVLNLQEIEKKIMPEIENWAPEKRAEWFKLFNTEPERALAEAVKEIVKPLTKNLAVGSNVQEVERLTDLHKVDVVPYVEKEVDALISANESWWKQYGTKIFEHAYDVFRNRNFDKYAAIREKNIKTKDDERTVIEEEKKNQTYVEGARPVKLIKSKKVLTLEQIQAADPNLAMTVIKKELLKRGVKVDD